MFNIVRYTPDKKNVWDDVIDQSDNAHFMIKRDFMDYHSDRFEDYSFLIQREEDGSIIGVIAGNKREDVWYSHQGLTFGGVFFLPKHNRTSNYINIMEVLDAELSKAGCKRMVYKFLPHIYHRSPCEADFFAMNNIGIDILYSEASTAVDLRVQKKPSNLRSRGKKKAVKLGVEVQESSDYKSFWGILEQRLEGKYDKKPVHSLDEIILLKDRFPENISLFAALDSKGYVVAGSVIFETNTVAHAQYIASSPEGQESGALDLLFLHLIDHYRDLGKRYFDFGISTENKGKLLNEPLIQFKEGFGGGTILHLTAERNLDFPCSRCD
ncbi:MAG: GNAT family N-acetyltransferase [Alphaproteobacteria bacterium]|nr:GNAT family N-acetyltransferase [Alphaproteobacteria bacterium]